MADSESLTQIIRPIPISQLLSEVGLYADKTILNIAIRFGTVQLFSVDS